MVWFVRMLRPSNTLFYCLVCVCSLIQMGQFFGEVDPVLMINLVNTSLYSFNKTYDYQSVCDPEKDSKAAAGPRSVYVVRCLSHKRAVSGSSQTSDCLQVYTHAITLMLTAGVIHSFPPQDL